MPKENKLGAADADDTVGAEEAGAEVLAKLKAGAVEVPPKDGPLVEDVAVVFAGVCPPSWKGVAFLSPLVSCGLLRLLKRPPVCWSPPLLPERSLLFFELVSKTLPEAAGVLAENVRGLLEG